MKQVSNKSLVELQSLESALQSAKNCCEKQVTTYSSSLHNHFNLSDEDVEKLDVFFEKTYILTIKELIEHYKVSIAGKRKGSPIDFYINVPVATTKTLWTPSQLEYLSMKYNRKFIELSLYELGIHFVKIEEKYWASNRLSEEIYYDEDGYIFSYVLRSFCSLRALVYNEIYVRNLKDD